MLALHLLLCCQLALAVQRLHVVTWSTRLDYGQAFLLASANAHQYDVVFHGVGGEGSWGKGMIYKFRSLRRYILERVADDEVVLAIDSADVLLLGNASELLDKFSIHIRRGPTIVFSAEAWGQPDKDYVSRRMHAIARAEQTALGIPENPYWALNAGCFIGLGASLKQLFHLDFIDSFWADHGAVHDQDWLRKQFIANPSMITVDYAASMLLSVGPMRGLGERMEQRDEYGGLADMVTFEDGRLRFKPSQQTPVALHFPGPGHWRIEGLSKESHKPTCIYLEVFRRVFPSAMENTGFNVLGQAALGCGMTYTNIHARRMTQQRNFLLIAVLLFVFFKMWCGRYSRQVHPEPVISEDDGDAKTI